LLKLQPAGSRRRVFLAVHWPVEKGGFTGLAEGAKVSYEVVNDRGKDSAGSLRL
jgi:CspA family cold shock protein